MHEMRNSEMDTYWKEKYPTKEDLKRRAAGGPGPSEARRQALRRKRRK